MSLYLGIDPGVAGAFALLDGDRLTVQDTQSIIVAGTKGRNRSEYDERWLMEALKKIAAGGCFIQAIIEQPQFRPGQDVVSVGRIGLGWGIWRMGLAAVKIPLRTVPAATWKKVVFKDSGLIVPAAPSASLTGAEKARVARQRSAQGKNASRELASRLWPQMSAYFERVGDHDRAEAALLAYYLRIQVEGR